MIYDNMIISTFWGEDTIAQPVQKKKYYVRTINVPTITLLPYVTVDKRLTVTRYSVVTRSATQKTPRKNIFSK